ncbi:polysaccharide deacetylase family protein [Falsiroseomonas sp.]|uniref:polysaccharide deacetylase family protein n=1 Tax=Falsiroseomonas sp. TaxID=2870721 RepID=UPI0035686362
MAVAPERFDEQLSVLRKHCVVMSLGRMLDELRAGTLVRNAVAVTFDDGYADNLHSAIPMLERHEVPATFFLSPGLLDGKSSFWWDELGWILLRGHALPEHLELSIEGTTIRRVRPGQETVQRPSPGTWRGWEPTTEPTEDLYLDLWKVLKPLRRDMQARLLSELRAWAGMREPAPVDARSLTLEEAARLANHPLAEIGAHTLTHPTLPAHDGATKRAEIAGSKQACEDIAGRAVRNFSYPYGDRDAETVCLVREAGFENALTTESRPVRRHHQLQHLPRIQMRDWNGAEFERSLLTGEL